MIHRGPVPPADPEPGQPANPRRSTAMRLQLRLALICLCIVAALAAGCSKDNGPSSTTGPGNARSAAQCANTIGNRVWFDTNCNGLQDSLETSGPLGVTVTLRNCDTQEERTTKTDATGHYSFTDVATGSYSICIDIPDGYKATLMDQGAVDSLDSDINADGCTGCESYDCSTDNLTRAAGLCVDEAAGACTNTIGSRVWYDTNCDGIQDGNETTGPEGVKVTLRNASAAHDPHRRDWQLSFRECRGRIVQHLYRYSGRLQGHARRPGCRRRYGQRYQFGRLHRLSGVHMRSQRRDARCRHLRQRDRRRMRQYDWQPRLVRHQLQRYSGCE